MLGEAPDEEDQETCPLDQVAASKVPRHDERRACERDDDRPQTPRPPRNPSAETVRRTDRHHEEHEMMEVVETEAYAEHGEQFRVHRETRRTDGAGQQRQGRGPQARLSGCRLGSTVSLAIAGVAMVIDLHTHVGPVVQDPKLMQLCCICFATYCSDMASFPGLRAEF